MAALIASISPPWAAGKRPGMPRTATAATWAASSNGWVGPGRAKAGERQVQLAIQGSTEIAAPLPGQMPVGDKD